MNLDTTELDLDEFTGYFQEMADNFNKYADYQEFLESYVIELRSFHDDYWANQEDPTGKNWAPLSPKTIAKKGHSTILVDTERLWRSLTESTIDSICEVIDEGMNHGISFGTSVPYSIFHQEGTERMPARPHVGINNDKVDDLTERTADRTVEIVIGD